MSEEMKDTSNIMEAAAATNAEQTALLEFTEQDILNYEEGELTKKEKAKFLLLSPLPNAIIKFVLIGLGLIGAILWLVAALAPGFSDSMVGFYKGYSTVVSAINNLIPFSVFEIVIILAVLGWLGYLVFILIRFFQTRKNGKLLATRLWIQFGYSTLAVVLVFTMLFSFGYGLMSNRSSFQKATADENGNAIYTLAPTSDHEMAEAMLYLVDKLNHTVIEANEGDTQHFDFNGSTGASRANIGSGRKAKLAKYVSDAYQKAAQDIPELAGPKLTAKETLASPLYNAQYIGSIYSPITGEVLYNPYYPEVAIPMLVARAIAMERGFQNEAQANAIAYIVCTKYSDVPYVQYSAYFDAYVNLGSYMARYNAYTHATVASALKLEIKKEVIYYTKQLDKIYGNKGALQFADQGQGSSNENYLVYPELLTDYYRNKIANDVESSERNCGHYCHAIIDLYRQDADWQDSIDTVVAKYNEYQEITKQETIQNIIQGNAPTTDTPAEGTEGAEGENAGTESEAAA